MAFWFDHHPSPSSSSSPSLLPLASPIKSSSRSTTSPSLMSSPFSLLDFSESISFSSAAFEWSWHVLSDSLEIVEVLPRIWADRIRSPDSPKCDPTGVVDSSQGFPGSSSISSLGVVREKSTSSVAEKRFDRTLLLLEILKFAFAVYFYCLTLMFFLIAYLYLFYDKLHFWSFSPFSVWLIKSFTLIKNRLDKSFSFRSTEPPFSCNKVWNQES